jgi:hypothetical protein
MLDWRTLGLGVVVFGATFAVGWWLGLGRPAPAAAVTEAKPAISAPEGKPQQVAVLSQPAPLAKAWPKGKGLTENDGLRQAVILRAKAYQRPACNADAKTLYVIAATKYAEVLLRSAGCNNFPRCPMGMGTLDDVWRLNRSRRSRRAGHRRRRFHLRAVPQVRGGRLAQRDLAHPRSPLTFRSRVPVTASLARHTRDMPAPMSTARAAPP